MQKAGIAVVGAGAAGLMAAIQAARQAPDCRVVALDGATRIGAKILIAGGGRCNVTHRVVAEGDFSGSTPAAIRRVLRRFDVADIIAFFAALGVGLHEEATGKLFPDSNRAVTIVDALVRAAQTAGVHLHHPCRVTRVDRHEDGFTIQTTTGTWQAQRVVLATGGRSVPKTGSDGQGYAIATALGLPLTPAFYPALVPLTLPEGHWVRALSGVSTPVGLTVRSSTGRHLRQVDGPLLCTHLGISGPAALDVSRHWQVARNEDAGVSLAVDWLPGETEAEMERRLTSLGRRSCLQALSPPLPERLALALLAQAGVADDTTGATLSREGRRRLVRAVHADVLPATGTRGYAVAEVTAGGVPLSALHLDRLEARACPGLHLCGEICDVDGRLGGFNFQWAWASGTVAGRGAATALTTERTSRTCVTMKPAP
jgi:predicted Rossmann fold flavoprotein